MTARCEHHSVGWISSNRHSRKFLTLHQAVHEFTPAGLARQPSWVRLTTRAHEGQPGIHHRNLCRSSGDFFFFSAGGTLVVWTAKNEGCFVSRLGASPGYCVTTVACGLSNLIVSMEINVANTSPTRKRVHAVLPSARARANLESTGTLPRFHVALAMRDQL